MKILACLLTLVMFIGFSCSGGRDVCDCGVPDNYSPTVRLVKDTDRSFHFQWDDTLLAERIVLARYTRTQTSIRRARALNHDRSNYTASTPVSFDQGSSWYSTTSSTTPNTLRSRYSPQQIGSHSNFRTGCKAEVLSLSNTPSSITTLAHRQS